MLLAAARVHVDDYLLVDGAWREVAGIAVDLPTVTFAFADGETWATAWNDLVEARPDLGPRIDAARAANGRAAELFWREAGEVAAMWDQIHPNLFSSVMANLSDLSGRADARRRSESRS